MSESDYEEEGLRAPIPIPQGIPAEMIAAIATGLEDPEIVADRYGFRGREWIKIQEWQPFKDAVAAHIAEFEKNGLTFKLKAKALTEAVFEDAFKIARSNDATLMQKLEFIKLGAKLADMEPKTNTAQVAQGPGFSISINFSQPPKHVIDVNPKEIEESPNESSELQPAEKRRTLPSE